MKDFSIYLHNDTFIKQPSDKYVSVEHHLLSKFRGVYVLKDYDFAYSIKISIDSNNYKNKIEDNKELLNIIDDQRIDINYIERGGFHVNDNRLWSHLKIEDKENYINFLEIFGSISGLFKDITEGSSAKKPYLYYRNHEQLFAKVFQVHDLTRSDSAFDAIAEISGKRIGIGLKTWSHLRDLTFQKVAEFNKAAPYEINPLIENSSPLEVVKKISELRNERISLDKRQYATDIEIYHSVTRDDNVMYIVESSYDFIDIDSLKIDSYNGSTFNFNDKINKYKYYRSKSVLLKEFDASSNKIIERIPITLYDDPFDLLKMINLPHSEESEKHEILYLPIYSDLNGKVMEKSGFNAWNGKPKTKGSNLLRPNFEAYIPIPKWIHLSYPLFFGFNALNKVERSNAEPLNLHLPDGRVVKAIITQDNGKSLETDPQSVLGEWILHDVLGLKARELLTMERLIQLGVDSLKLTKIDRYNFRIELADLYSYEVWKNENRVHINSAVDKANARKPKYREIGEQLPLLEDI